MSLEDLQPDEVVALPFDVPEAIEDLAAWCNGEIVGDVLSVPTKRGPKPAAVGDWIVMRSDRSFEVHDAASFAAVFGPSSE